MTSEWLDLSKTIEKISLVQRLKDLFGNPPSINSGVSRSVIQYGPLTVCSSLSTISPTEENFQFHNMGIDNVMEGFPPQSEPPLAMVIGFYDIGAGNEKAGFFLNRDNMGIAIPNHGTVFGRGALLDNYTVILPGDKPFTINPASPPETFLTQSGKAVLFPEVPFDDCLDFWSAGQKAVIVEGDRVMVLSPYGLEIVKYIADENGRKIQVIHLEGQHHVALSHQTVHIGGDGGIVSYRRAEIVDGNVNLFHSAAEDEQLAHVTLFSGQSMQVCCPQLSKMEKLSSLEWIYRESKKNMLNWAGFYSNALSAAAALRETKPLVAAPVGA